MNISSTSRINFSKIQGDPTGILVAGRLISISSLSNFLFNISSLIVVSLSLINLVTSCFKVFTKLP